MTPDIAAKTGALLGAKVLVSGRLFEAGGKYYLAAKIIDTETGRVFDESETFAEMSGLDRAVGALASKLVGTLKEARRHAHGRTGTARRAVGAFAKDRGRKERAAECQHGHPAAVLTGKLGPSSRARPRSTRRYVCVAGSQRLSKGRLFSCPVSEGGQGFDRSGLCEVVRRTGTVPSG